MLQQVALHAKQCHKLEALPPADGGQSEAAIKTVTVTV